MRSMAKVKTQRRYVPRMVNPILFSTFTSLALISGCQAYKLQGVVLDGPSSAVLTVHKVDPRLKQPGISGAVVELTLDPSTLKSVPIGTAVTNDEGQFCLSVSQAGAGFLEYEAGVLCRVRDYGTVYQTLPLPPKDKRLLIIVAPGVSGQPRMGNILQETLEIGRQLNQ